MTILDYKIALKSRTYPTIYNGLIDFLAPYITELEAARGGEAALIDNFDNYVPRAGLTANLPAAGFKITGLGNPTSANDAVNKAYADGLAFAAVLPSQAGNNGAIISTDGTTAFWTFDYAKKNGNAAETFSLATQASTDRSTKGASTAFVQERIGLNATTLFLRG